MDSDRLIPMAGKLSPNAKTDLPTSTQPHTHVVQQLQIFDMSGCGISQSATTELNGS
jgi:hypothetical protein